MRRNSHIDHRAQRPNAVCVGGAVWCSQSLGDVRAAVVGMLFTITAKPTKPSGGLPLEESP